jgi:hypothetical protein
MASTVTPPGSGGNAILAMVPADVLADVLADLLADLSLRGQVWAQAAS